MAQFSGEPRTVWLTQPSPDRLIRLLEDFWFDDRRARRWDAPEGGVLDGASIPRALSALVGPPYTGRYRRASIVHDVACERATTPAERRAADRMFYEACREGGCSVREAAILYLGVSIGAAWPFKALLDVEAQAEPRLVRSFAEKRLEADFQLAGQRLLEQPLPDDAEAVERAADEALASVGAA